MAQTPLRNATVTRALPAGTTLADITTQIKGLDDLFGAGAPASWAAIDLHKWDEVFGIDSIPVCYAECGAAQAKLFEDIKSGYVMFNFDSGDRWAIPIRGDFGVRYVKHRPVRRSGYPPDGAPADVDLPIASANTTKSCPTTRTSCLRFNVVFEPTHNLLLASRARR